MALSSNLTTFSNVTDGAPLSPDYLNGKFGVLDKNIGQLNTDGSLSAWTSGVTMDLHTNDGLLSLATHAATSNLVDTEVGLVFATSGMSLLIRSGSSVYDIGSNTSAAV